MTELGVGSIMLKLLVLCSFCAVAKQRRSGVSREDVLLQEAVKSLLGFEDLPLGESGKVFNADDKKSAPKYMLHLYEKFRSGAIREDNGANTVRSIHSQIGLIKRQAMFIFNLTSISPSEEILKAEILIYKKRPRDKRKGSNDVIIAIHELGPNFISKLSEKRLPGVTMGWQTFSVTEVLKKCLVPRRNPPRLLALSFSVVQDDEQPSNLVLHDFAKRLSRPFLINFSNDSQNISLDHIDPHLLMERTQDAEAAFVNPENGRMESVNEKYLKPNSHKGRHRTSVDDDAGGRRKRSIYDNEIPEHLDEDVVPPPQYNVPRTNPEILTRRTNSHRRLTTPSLAPEIPYPATEGRIETEEDGEQRNRKKKHRRRKNHQRNKTLKEHHKNNKGQERKGKGLCSKRTLVIDFADIGWSEWIISPKSFEANVCAGSCPFPRAKNLMASNHATLQSLVRAVGIQEGVPAPCCVPEQLSSLTLLYFDQDKNVVLKNYNGMTVHSCSCR